MISKYIKLIADNLDETLLHKKFKAQRNKFSGHCYISSECSFYLFAKDLGFKPKFIRHEGQPHWYLANDKWIIDITASQFKTEVPYQNGKGKGFLTNKPSKRCQTLMDKIKKAQNE